MKLYLGDRLRFIIDWLDAKREVDLPFPEIYHFSLGSHKKALEIEVYKSTGIVFCIVLGKVYLY